MNLNSTTIIFAILVLIIIGFLFYINKYARLAPNNTEDVFLSVDYLTTLVNETFGKITRASLKDQNLTRAELERKERQKEELKIASKEASMGDKEAKRFILSFIKDIINDKNLGGVNELNINTIVPFDNPSLIRSRIKFELMLFVWNAKLGKQGFVSKLYEHKLNEPIEENGILKWDITKERLSEVYNKESPTLGFNDKLNFISQLIYERLIGHGAVDMLLESSVDEVQGGTSGIPADSYETIESYKDLDYSYEAIWVIVSGVPIRLSCTSFETQDELVRVCQNIYRYNAPSMLTRKDGKVIGTMKNGSRITVARPPFAESYVFLARKFDSTPSIAPEQLLTDKNSYIPIKMSKWIVKGCMNVLVTGEQGCGKTTWLKSLIRYIDPAYSLRINEIQPELNLRYTYPDRNIVSFSETQEISSQDGLNFQKKTSGMVNIIGEIATAAAGSWYIQTTKVASKFGLGTHHAETTDNLITSFRDYIMQTDGYTNETVAEETVARAINYDIHMTKNAALKHRYLERITEIMPITDREYPEDLKSLKGGKKTDIDIASMINTSEYQKRMTDRANYTHKNLVEWQNGKYVLLSLPSKEMIEMIEENLSDVEITEFRNDMIEFLNILKNSSLGE